MKKRYIVSGLLGGGFFAASYLALSLPIIPASLTAVAAFASGLLMFKDGYSIDDLGEKNQESYRKLLEDSHNNLKALKKVKSQISDIIIEKHITNIIDSTEKIIKVLHEKPNKIASASKFLNYYLPVTIRILERFDEIYDQKLTSDSSKEFLDRIRNMIINIEEAFDNQLNNLYNDELIDTNAEIKVFEAMLKEDGLLGNSILINKDGDIDEKH